MGWPLLTALFTAGFALGSMFTVYMSLPALLPEIGPAYAGTGGGIINAKEFLVKSDYCIVVNTDIITNFNPSDIINGHQSSERDVTLLIQKRNSKKYLSFDTEMNFLGRYSDGSDNAIPYAFNGIHVISKNFFNIVSNDGFADIIDLYVQNKNRLNIKGYDAGGSKFIDIGKIENPEL